MKISASMAVVRGSSGALSSGLRLRFIASAQIDACSELEAVGAEFRPGTARLIATKNPPGRANQSCHGTSPLIYQDCRLAPKLHSRCDADHKNALCLAI